MSSHLERLAEVTKDLLSSQKGTSVLVDFGEPNIEDEDFARKAETAYVDTNKHRKMSDILELVRVRVKKQLATTFLGKFYDYCLLTLSLLSPIASIYQTYLIYFTLESQITQQSLLDSIELILASIFTFDWFLNYFIADNKVVFMTDFFAMIDMLTVLPIWVQKSTGIDSVTYEQFRNSTRDAFLYLVYFLGTTRVLRALRVRRKLLMIQDEIDKVMSEIALTISVMLLFCASAMSYLEGHIETQPTDYHTWTYYIWITMSTVGYGDISPKSELGRLFAMGMIAVALISVPNYVNELIEKMAQQSIYARQSFHKKSSNGSHIIITGDVGSTSLNEFFDELFHEDHENDNLFVVLLFPDAPSFQIIMKMRDPDFNHTVTYLEGSPLDEKDLRRSLALQASAFFIMSNKFSMNPDEEDSKTILQQFSIRNYANQEPTFKAQFFIQLIRPENKRHFQGDNSSGNSNDHIICLNELKMGIIARSVMFPGVNTFIMNLLSSFADEEEDEKDNTAGTKEIFDEESGNWLNEYEKGCDWEIYSTELSDMFEGLTFAYLAESLFQKIGIILMGLKMQTSQGMKIYLNPSEYVIRKKSDQAVIAFVLAKNKAQSDLTFIDTAANSLIYSQLTVMLHAGLMHSKTDKTVSDSKEDGGGESAEIDKMIEMRRMQSKKSKKVAWLQLLQKHSGSAEVELVSEEEQFHNVNDAFMYENYFIRSQPVKLDKITVNSVQEDLPGCHDHLIIVGRNVNTIYGLIHQLRSKRYLSCQPIVILYPYKFPSLVWQKIRMYDHLYIVRGFPLSEEDLRRVGVYRCKRAIILADADSKSGTKNMESLIDASAIFCYQSLKRMKPTIEVVIEIVMESNVGYLDVDATTSNDYRFTPQFANGILFTSSLLDTIVCQAFFNVDIIDLILKFVTFDGDHFSRSRKKDKISSSSLFQIDIPEGLESRTFGALFKFLVQRQMVAVALYRGLFPGMKVGPKSNKLPYVFTNPPKDTELFSCDKVFVLSAQPPFKKTRVAEMANYHTVKQSMQEIIQTKAATIVAAVDDLTRRQEDLRKAVVGTTQIFDDRLGLMMEVLEEYKQKKIGGGGIGERGRELNI